MRLWHAKTPKAMLSRAVAGIRGEADYQPAGKCKRVKESLEAVLPALDHALDILLGSAAECGQG